MSDSIRRTIDTYSAHAEVYASVNASVEGVLPQLEAFRAYLSGPRLLDVGCGPGRDARYFAGHGLQVTGVDLTPRFVQMARAAVPAGRFLLADMRRLPAAAGRFDGLWVMASLLHLPEAEVPAALAEFWRVLRPGGVLFVSVKQGEGARMVPAAVYGGGERFFNYFTPPRLRDALAAAGFAIPELFSNTGSRDTWINAVARK